MDGLSLAERLRTRPGMALVLGAVALASVLLYIPTMDFGFVWDDTSLIVENPQLAESTPWSLFGRTFWSGAAEPPEGGARTFYRPLVMFSFWADMHLAGANPAFFHVVNIVLNAIACILVALIIWEILHSGVWAALGGLLFATHPAHVESTAFISGRTDLLLTVFICLAAFMMLRAVRKHDFRWAVLVPVGYGLALLSKETAILFPVLVALAPLLTQTRYDTRYWLVIAATAAVGAGYLVLRSHVVGGILPPVLVSATLSRFIEVANTSGLYLRMFIWPFHHQVKYPADPAFANLTPYAIAALLFVVTLPLLAVRRRYWIVALGFTWTILFLLPVSNIVAIGPLAAERLLYLPSAGLAIIVACLLSRLLPGRVPVRRAAAAGLALVCLAFAADSLFRTRVWRDEATLFTAMTRESPGAPSAYANLANVVRQTNADSAIRLYNHALALDQGYTSAHINVGILYCQQGDHRRGLHHLRLANELDPGSARVQSNLGLAFLAAGEPESALVYVEQAVALEPASSAARVNRAVVLDAAGRGAEAEAELRRLVADDPGFVPARLLLAERLERLGRLDSAAVHLELALRLDSTQVAACNRLGTLLVQLGDSTRAMRCYDRALGLDPDFVPALFNQAILAAARGDSAAAARLAGRAYRLRPDVPAIAGLYRQLKGLEE